MKSRISLNSSLGQFLAGFFHQDWTLDYSSTEEAVSDYLIGSSETDIQQVLAELREFSAAVIGASEDEIESRLGCDYVVGREAGIDSYSKWLGHIVNLLESKQK